MNTRPPTIDADKVIYALIRCERLLASFAKEHPEMLHESQPLSYARQVLKAEGFQTSEALA